MSISTVEFVKRETKEPAGVAIAAMLLASNYLLDRTVNIG